MHCIDSQGAAWPAAFAHLEGCAQDYTGATVNSKTFLSVLQGEQVLLDHAYPSRAPMLVLCIVLAERCIYGPTELGHLCASWAQAFTAIGSSGKTIKSGPEDRVFVYFADHGAPGAPLLAEPGPESLFIWAVWVGSNAVQRGMPQCTPSVAGQSDTTLFWAARAVSHVPRSWACRILQTMRAVFLTAGGGVAGILGMPNGPFLYADELLGALANKSAANGFRDMVLYIEACESGSIFEVFLAPNQPQARALVVLLREVSG